MHHIMRPKGTSWAGPRLNPTYSVETGGAIYICSVSEYAQVNKNNNDTTVIRYLDSYFEYFYFHDTPITVDLFDEYLDARGSHFASLQVPLKSTTVVVDPLDKFIDTSVSPFSSVHVPSRYTIDSCEQYP